MLRYTYLSGFFVDRSHSMQSVSGCVVEKCMSDTDRLDNMRSPSVAHHGGWSGWVYTLLNYLYRCFGKYEMTDLIRKTLSPFKIHS